MSHLIRAILHTPWMIDSSAASLYAPQVMKLLQGENVDFNQIDVKGSVISRDSSGVNGSNSSNNINVAVLPIRGVITKDDQYCGPEGTESKNRILKNWISDPGIDAIILDLDTPGGQATFLATISETIRSSSKPILAHYSGLCASAGYFIGSSALEIYANEKNDEVGSIGCMVTFADFTEFYEKQGIKLHEVYADQSKDKNQMFKKALKGDYKELKEEVLNEYAQEFIDTVKMNRQNVSKEALTGKIYTTEKAIELGLIDGQKTFEEVIDRAVELVQENRSTSSKTKSTTMKNSFLAVAAILGYESLEVQDGHVSLSVEDMEKIDAAIASHDQEIEQATENASALEAIESRLESIANSVNETTTAINSFEARVAKLENPGATETQTAAIEQEFEEGEDEFGGAPDLKAVESKI